MAARTGMPSSTETQARLHALGHEITPAMLAGTRALYANAIEPPSSAECVVHRDITYGSHERHRLDLFVPNDVNAHGLPVLLFVHGGGFIAGDKGGANEPYYSNVGVWAAKQGFVGATVNYRLAPAATWPSGIEDIERAMRWLHENVDQHGGDPSHIVLFGQSAGATHVGGYVASRSDSRPCQAAAAVMFSGLYDLLSLEHSPREHAYFGTDASRFAEQSPLPGLLTSSLSCLYAVSELDPSSFRSQALRLVTAHLETRGLCPRMHHLRGHNHLSPVLSLGAEEGEVSRLLRDFVCDPGADYRRSSSSSSS